jgi:hypothetical protein
MDIAKAYIVLYILIGLFVFLIGREIMLWYWKVNHIVTKLDSIERHLELIASKLSSNYVEQDTPQKKSVSDV